jgi:hypothetical protein
MKKVIVLAALAFALATGTVTLMTVHLNAAMADGNCSSC